MAHVLACARRHGPIDVQLDRVSAVCQGPERLLGFDAFLVEPAGGPSELRSDFVGLRMDVQPLELSAALAVASLVRAPAVQGVKDEGVESRRTSDGLRLLSRIGRRLTQGEDARVRDATCRVSGDG